MLRRLSKEIVDKLVDDNVGDFFVAMPIKPKITRKVDTVYDSFSFKSVVELKANKYSILCSCKESNGEVQENSSPTCKYCGETLEVSYSRHRRKDMSYLVDTESRKKIKELWKFDDEGKYVQASNGARKIHYNKILFDGKVSDKMNSYIYSKINQSQISSFQLLQTYYVREKLDGQIGIDIMRVTVSIKPEGDTLTKAVSYDKFCEIIPGQKAVAYKYTKARGEEEIDLFDAFHISIDNLKEEEDVFFEGADSMIDFFYNNFEFSKRTGFLELLQNYNWKEGGISENSFFLLYMYLYSEFPVIELLVKQKYYSLIFSLINDVANTYNRGRIEEKVQNLEDLLKRSTKGSNQLTIPPYIGSFLNQKCADLSDYMAWAAINELSPISEENFNEIVNSEAYYYMNYYNILGKIPNIMKYGYTFKKCMKYIMQQYSKDSRWKTKNCREIQAIVQVWQDYLEYCELMDVEPAKYPQDIKKTHDDIMVAYQAQVNADKDRVLAKIADKYAGYVTTSKYYDIVVPRSVHDFVQEGNNMHNCVGGYANRVASGACRVFFIRKKDNIEKSYITAECLPDGRLSQIFYHNNTYVNNAVERNYAEAFCKYIMQKGW